LFKIEASDQTFTKKMLELDDNNMDLDENFDLDSDQEDFERTFEANAIVSQRKKLKKRSSVWQYYVEIEADGKRYAECKICVQQQM